MSYSTPLLLIILDGFGISAEIDGNPIAYARIPTIEMIERNFPFTTLQASGVAVGLPWGEAGNSEVGHLTIGSGRVIYHHLPRIITAIHDGAFFENEAFLKAVEHVRANASSLHIAGLVSSGSVHSYIDHLYALLELCREKQVERVYLHIFADGKDAPPKEGALFLGTLEKRMATEWPNARIASVTGRFYALDRDDQWGRVQRAYHLLTEGTGNLIMGSITSYIEDEYAKGLSDEFIEPAAVADSSGVKPLALIQDNDALIFSDFREDSMREVTHAFSDEVFDKFPRKKVANLLIVTMTEYQKDLPVFVAFPSLDISWPLSRVLGDAGFKHLHIAETQKYAHVTYFFNGGIEEPLEGEERILIHSINTSHYDEVPYMRAPEITQSILEHLTTHSVIIANFANADMVGHTGNFEASVRAVEVLDESLSQIITAISNAGGTIVITADHGNIERKRNILSGERLTEHSTNPVPFYLIENSLKRKNPRGDKEREQQRNQVSGVLIDVAPTVIELLGLKKPLEMTGQSLLPLLLKQEG